MIYPPDYSSGGLLFVLELFLIICIITVVGIASSNTFNIKNIISFIISLLLSVFIKLYIIFNGCSSMDFLRKHRKICSAVATLMVAILVVYSYGSFRSYAAAPEVSTLPADNIGAEVNYDADSITLNYNGNTYVFNRHMSFDEFISDLEPVDELL